MSVKICKVASVGKWLRKQPVGDLQMLRSTFVHKVEKITSQKLKVTIFGVNVSVITLNHFFFALFLIFM